MDIYIGLSFASLLASASVYAEPQSSVNTDWCFEEHVHYIGLGLPKIVGDNTYGSTGSAQGCQLLCQDTDGCEWFNWEKKLDKCWLKTGKGDQTRQKPGGVTGPRNCPPDEVALIVTGSLNLKVELWSPSGKCNRKLKDWTIITNITTNYVNGLILSCGAIFNKCYYLNPETEEWVFHSNLLSPRVGHSSFVMNGTSLYLFGGVHSFSSPTIEYLEPTTGEWIEGPSGNKQIGTCSVQTSPNTFAVTGGSNDKIGEEYNFITKEWRTFGNAAEATRTYHGCTLIQTKNVFGILIAGGHGDNVANTSSFLDLNENSPTWKKSSDTNFRYLDGKMVKLNNRYFILGGYLIRGGGHLKVEEYHPENGTWTSGLNDLFGRNLIYDVTAVPSSLFPNCN